GRAAGPHRPAFASVTTPAPARRVATTGGRAVGVQRAGVPQTGNQRARSGSTGISPARRARICSSRGVTGLSTGGCEWVDGAAFEQVHQTEAAGRLGGCGEADDGAQQGPKPASTRVVLTACSAV